MKIYVIGAYTAKTPRQVQMNVDCAIEYGCALIRLGHDVYIPHLLHYIEMHRDGDFDYDTWHKMGGEFLKLCDAVFAIPSWHLSKGAVSEVQKAEELGITVYYLLDEIPDVKE